MARYCMLTVGSMIIRLHTDFPDIVYACFILIFGIGYMYQSSLAGTLYSYLRSYIPYLCFQSCGLQIIVLRIMDYFYPSIPTVAWLWALFSILYYCHGLLGYWAG